MHSAREASSLVEVTHGRAEQRSVDARLDAVLLRLRVAAPALFGADPSADAGADAADAARALHELDQWRVGWPGHARLAIVTALAAFVCGDLATAVRHGDLAVRFDPRRYRPPQSTAESIAFWVYGARREQLEALPPAAADAYELGRCRAMFGDYAQALEAYALALRARPNDAEILTAAGAAYRVLGRTFEAVRMHERAIEACPELALAHSNLVAALADAGRLREAQQASKRALQLDSTLGAAPLNLGIGLLKASRYDEALDALGSVAEHDPALLPAAAVHLATAHHLLGAHEVAMEVVARGESHELAHRVPHLDIPRAAALRALGRQAPAAEAAERLWVLAL